MSKFISCCECIFWTWEMNMSFRELYPIQNELWMEIYDKVWRSYAWSKLGWLFLQNPNLATFGFWWIMSNPWWIMINPWSNDEIYLKMRMLTKILKFDCIWVTIDFCPNIVDFWTLWAIDWANFLCKAWNLTWMTLRTY